MTANLRPGQLVVHGVDLTFDDTQRSLAAEIDHVQETIKETAEFAERNIPVPKNQLLFLLRARRDSLVTKWQDLSGERWVDRDQLRE